MKEEKLQIINGMPGPGFVFIDNTAINEPAARYAIRSKVMQGKNLGRLLCKQRRPPKTRFEKTRSENVEPTSLVPSRKRQALTCRILMQPEDKLLGVPHGHKITARDKHFAYSFLRGYIELAYPLNICSPCASEFKWFESFFEDEAFFHTWAAAAQLALGKVTTDGKPLMAKDCIEHIGHSLRLTNQNISSNRGLSNNTLVCVLLLCCINDMCGRLDQFKIHFAGLVRIIQLRGGIQQLLDCRFMALEAQIYDINLSLKAESPPSLKQQYKPIEALISQRIKFWHIESPLLHWFQDTVELQDIVKDLFKLSQLFDTRTAETKLSLVEYKEVTIQMRYRLLDFYSEGKSVLGDPVSAALHLGCLAFAMTLDSIMNPFGKSFERVFKAVRASLEHPEFLARIDPNTHLWLLIITAISVSPNAGAWVTPYLLNIVAMYGRSDWGFAAEVLRTFPWVRCLHDRAASEYWESLFGRDIPSLRPDECE